jgi:hypothetical protein
MNNDTVKSVIDLLWEKNKPKSKYWPYDLEVKELKQHTEAERFCYTHFKTRNWRNHGVYFYFKRKEDYEWFVLRWS